jgi:hypothetical protein
MAMSEERGQGHNPKKSDNKAKKVVLWFLRE